MSLLLLGQRKSLAQQVAALFPDVWYDPSDFNSSWRRNLLTYSEQFDNAAWTKTNASVTQNAIAAPDGTTTADKLIATAVSGTHYASQAVASISANTNYSVSVYVKAAEYGWAIVYVGSIGAGKYVNLSTGALGANFIGAPTAAAVSDAGSGWWRVTLTVTSGANTSCDVRVYTTTADNTSSFTGDGTSGIYIWGAQLELGTTASTYQKITDGVADYYVYGSPLPVLYQDSSGTTPVTALEQPVGLMLDKSRGLVLGAELVVNGDFSSGATGWSVGGGWSVSGGAATHAVGTTDVLSQAIALTAGRFYQVTFTLSNASGSQSVQPRFTGGTIVAGTGRSTNGTYTEYIAAVSGNTAIAFVANAAFGCTIDNISVRELPGAHAYHTPGDTTTRPVVSRRINLLTKTESFDDAAWVKTNAGITQNAITAPDGTLTADKFIPNSGIGGATTAQSVSVSVAAYTFQFRAKAAEQSVISLVSNLTGTFRANIFSLSAQTVSAGTGWTASIAPDPAGGGWFICTCSATADTAASKAFQISNNSTGWTGDGTSGIYIWGASLVPADLAALPYQRVNTTTDYDSDPSKFPTFLRTDGANDGMQTNAIDFSGTDKMFVGAAVRKLTNTGAQIIAELSQNLNDNTGTFYVSGPISNDAIYGFVSKGSAPLNGAITTASGYSAPITNVVTGQGNISGDSAILRVNGAQAASSSSDQGTGNFGNHKLYLFMRAGTSLPFNGWFYGGLIKGATLSASQIALAERWLASKTKTVTLA